MYVLYMNIYLLDESQIFTGDFSEVLKGTGAAAKLVVGVVLGHGDPVDVDVHGTKAIELAFHDRPAHHLPPEHLHMFPLVLSVCKE